MAALAGWSYRKSITLSRASGAVTNYQMRLKVGESAGAAGEDVDCGALCKTDFSDLRFTKADGTTLLDYYIEDITGTTPNQLASIWIEFDSIGTGATTFYMYYGNSVASAVSNGPNTFILFEDFNALNTADLNGQNGWSGSANWDVQATTKYEGAKSVQSTTANIPGISKAISSGAEALYHLSLQVRMLHTSVATANGIDIYLFEGVNQISAIAISVSQFQALVTPPSWVNIGKAAANNTWYKARLDIDAIGTHKTWVDDVQYSPVNQNNLFNVSSTINKISLEQATNGGTALFDQIIICYWLPSRPAWGSWGSQEVLISRSQNVSIF